jgi:hypothetical protein
MSEFSDWFQNNWIDLARLGVQVAILVAVLRIGRKLLATLRASQEQVGALLRLSVSDSMAERSAPAAEPETEFEPQPASRFEPSSVLIPKHEPEPEPEPEPAFAGAFSRGGYSTEREQSLGGRVLGSAAPAYQEPIYRTPAYQPAGQRAENPSLTPWVSAPAIDPASEPVRANMPAPPLAAARPSASSWLQAPMRSNPSASPWRKMVRWLQAPARH